MGERLVVQQLELEARGRLRGISIVGDEIAPTQFERIHADLGGSEFDKAFGDSHRDWMTDGAVLALTFLFWNTTRACARSSAFIQAAGEIDDLVSLDALVRG
jgi:hypothetical protein